MSCLLGHTLEGWVKVMSMAVSKGVVSQNNYEKPCLRRINKADNNISSQETENPMVTLFSNNADFILCSDKTFCEHLSK